MEYVWLAVALLILVALVWRPFQRSVLGGLDERSERIRKELDEAQRLHEEAKSMLARYRRQLHEGEELARDISERAETERRRLEERMRADFQAITERRTQQALDRIAQEEGRAVGELRTRAASLAVRATRELLTERLDEAEAQRMMRNAVGEVQRRLA
jgi:F-type H+-transporting ATPase subunit b